MLSNYPSPKVGHRKTRHSVCIPELSLKFASAFYMIVHSRISHKAKNAAHTLCKDAKSSGELFTDTHS